MTAPALTLLGNAFEANFCLRKVPKDVWRPRISGLKNLHRLSGFLASGFRSVLPMSQADSDLSLDDLPVIPGDSVSPHAFLAKKEPTQRQNLITGKTLSILEIHQ
jgi:hypothetical protein